MKPCTKVGLEFTRNCRASCSHCFWRFRGMPSAPTLQQSKAKIDQSYAGGLDHVVLVGYGEPSLAEETVELLQYAHSKGMASSMITLGNTGLRRFQQFVRLGVDHFHISSHGLGDTVDEIVKQRGTFRKQAELKEWLRLEEVPFRTNAAMQQANYRELPYLAEYEIEHGTLHFVFLGFLPHGEWSLSAYRENLLEVAVHPAHLRPYIEDGAEVLLDDGVYFTIRYHPLCHLAPKYWPYVVNARYCQFDPWEWNYQLQAHDPARLWEYAKSLGESVAIQGRPCSDCLARRHCGGWNRTYAAAFDGADLKPIRDVPDQYRDVWLQDGGLHDLNPANHHSGTIRRYTWMGTKDGLVCQDRITGKLLPDTP